MYIQWFFQLIDETIFLVKIEMAKHEGHETARDPWHARATRQHQTPDVSGPRDSTIPQPCQGHETARDPGSVRGRVAPVFEITAVWDPGCVKATRRHETPAMSGPRDSTRPRPCQGHETARDPCCVKATIQHETPAVSGPRDSTRPNPCEGPGRFSISESSVEVFLSHRWK